MRVSTACPLTVDSLLWQPRPGAHALSVIGKATFLLRPGWSPLADVQEEPLAADVPARHGAAGSLQIASDRVPFKRRVDVVLVGFAYAAHGRPVSSLVARLKVGRLDKRIEVHGERWWTPEGRLSPAAPFTRRSLGWERAAGGPGTWNPAGVAASAPPDARGRRPAPCLLPPGIQPQSPAELLPPAGFGPIAPGWPERASKLRWHAPSWSHERWMERPLPDDIDAAYFNAAPPDQQLEQLAAGEPIVLEHLHPEHPVLTTSLDEVTPRATLYAPGAAPQELRLRCDTLCVDTERGVLTLTFRGVVPLASPAQEGEVVLTMDLRGSASADEEPASIEVVGEEEEAETLTPRRRAQESEEERTLPKGVQVGEDLIRTQAPPLVVQTQAPPLAVQTQAPPLAVQTQAAPLAPAPAALPFTRQSSRQETIELPPEAVAELAAQGLPFVATQAPVPRAAEPPPADDGALPFRRSAPPPPPAPVFAPVAPPEPVFAAVPAPVPVPVPAPVPVPVPVPVPAPVPVPVPAPAPAPVPAPAPAPAPAPQLDLPLPLCAALAALIAHRPDDQQRILDERRLRAADWEASHERWLAAIQAEATRWKKALLDEYDAAYVASLEEARGPIRPPDLARIVVASERGQTGAALEALDLPPDSAARIRRVWLARTVKDPKLLREVNDAVKAERATER